MVQDNLLNKKLLLLLIIVFLVLTNSKGYSEVKQVKQNNNDVNYWLKELENRKTSLNVNLNKKKQKEVIHKNHKTSKTVVKKTDNNIASPKKISVDFYKVDLHNVFRLLGQVSGKNIVVDEGVKGTLTLALENVPWTFVLDVIKSLKGLNSIEKNNTIMIYPKDKAIEWTNEPVGTGTLEAVPLEVKEDKDVVLDVPGGEVEVKSIMRASKTPVKDIMAAEELIKKASRQEKHGNIIGAYESLKKAVKLWPDNLKLNEKLAALALKQGNVLDAYNYAKQALKIYPKSSSAAAIAAISLAHMERYQDARTFFEMSMSNNPSKDTLWNYAVFLFSQGEYRHALRLINKIEAKFDISPEIIMLKAQCYDYLSKPAQALVEYRSLISSGSNVPKDMIQFAQLRIRALTNSKRLQGKGR